MDSEKTSCSLKVWGRFYLGLCMALVVMVHNAPCCANSAFAQETNDGTLHVLRPVIHAEQEEAELCLEFDHDLDAADHGRTASSIKLESGGKNISVKTQNISVIDNLLCLPSLEHHKEYRIVLTGLRAAKGEKLSGSYGFSFTVPDRSASLSFTGNAEDEGITRWQDNDPVLRSINVPRVHLELYRITDPAMMVAAWRDRQQTTLAPSESATFAHDHGEMVWDGDMELKTTLNKILEQSVALKEVASHFQSGLYLIVARAPEVKSEEIKTDDAKPDAESDAKTGSLATTAAAWLLRSDLRLHAVRDIGGYYGLAEILPATKSDPSAALKDVHVFAESADGKAITDIRTDMSGVGFLALASDKIDSAKSLFGMTDAGDIDFVDLTSNDVSRFTPTKNEASLFTDRPFYFPESSATIALLARDAQGNTTPKTNTTLSVQYADGSVYETIPVSAGPRDGNQATFSVPAINGTWSLLWRQADGGTLAQGVLRVTSNAEAPRIEMSSDRSVIPGNGDINLTFKSVTADNKAAPYISGQAFVSWKSPETMGAADGFKEWKDYHFGNGHTAADEIVPVASFVTNEKGIASFRVTLAPPDDHALLHTATLKVQLNAESGIAAPQPLTLPIKPRETIIGVQPLAVGARFPENGFARFSVIALDSDGHRQTADDLTYQIYEEGRSFDWYQAEGRWNYKPQQQKRRIGGGTLTLGTNAADIIEWPVAAGDYHLEIIDSSGTLRASLGFSAGWGSPDAASRISPLSLTPSDETWQMGQDVQLNFTLDHSSMVTAFIGGDHIRKLIHEWKPQGENSFIFTPDKDWNDNITIHVQADDLNMAGQVTLPRFHVIDDIPKIATSNESRTANTAATNMQLPSVLAVDDAAPLSFELNNVGKMSALYHYTLSTTPNVKTTDIPSTGSFTVPSAKSHTIAFAVSALHAGPASVKLDITGPLHMHVTQEWTTSIVNDHIGLSSAVRQRIEPQQSTSWPPSEKLDEKMDTKMSSKNIVTSGVQVDSILFLSSAPLYNAPNMLVHVLQQDPFTTSQIAGMLEVMRVWHDVIIDAGLLPESVIVSRQKILLSRLMTRQKPDGGFVAIPQDSSAKPPADQSDFASTSAALFALAHVDSNISKSVKPPIDQAVNWLQQRLQNTWFDENERSDRASAYPALAEANRMDNASLHYFSDTSAQKKLSPLAALQLAYAFAKIGDQPASAFWIDKSDVKSNLSEIPAASLPVLTGNPFFDASSVLPSLEALSGGAAKDKDAASNMEDVVNILRTTWDVQSRKGAWRVTINNDKRNLRNISVLQVPAKTPAPIIHNTGDAPISLFGTQMNADEAASSTPGATRHIYHLNGTEMGAHNPLDLDETYLVVLEGSWPGNASGMMVIHDHPAPALQITGCLPPAPIEADDSLAWLKSQTLSSINACETYDGGTSILLDRKDKNKDSTSWRVAYLAKATWRGSFMLSAAYTHMLMSGHDESVRTSRDLIEIR